MVMLQTNQHWQTVSRTLPAGERVYAIGDVHGCDSLLAHLHERIALDCQLRTIRRATLVYLGDYVNRGPASKQVLERVLQAPRWADQVVRLLGNHEAMFLDALKGGPLAATFWNAGGFQTLQSYGLSEKIAPMRLAAQQAMLADVRTKIPAEHIELLESGTDRFVLGDFFFCHAGVKPGVPLGRQSTSDLQWIGRAFLEAANDFGALVVHGHSKAEAPEVRTNRVGLDTGAYQTGRLTCGVFEDNRVKFITTGSATAHAVMTGPRLRTSA